MLSDQYWIFLAPEMMTEWTQCMDEGLDVESFRPVCEEIAKNGKDWEALDNYDLILNSAKIGTDGCVECIMEYMKIRGLLDD